MCILHKCLFKSIFENTLSLNHISNYYDANSNVKFAHVLHEFNNRFIDVDHRVHHHALILQMMRLESIKIVNVYGHSMWKDVVNAPSHKLFTVG